jgi:hypothetical protein
MSGQSAMLQELILQFKIKDDKSLPAGRERNRLAAPMDDAPRAGYGKY